MRYIFTVDAVARIIESRPCLESVALYERAIVCRKTRQLISSYLKTRRQEIDFKIDYKPWLQVTRYPYFYLLTETVPLAIKNWQQKKRTKEPQR